MSKLTQIVRSSGNLIKNSGKEIVSPKYQLALQEWRRLNDRMRKNPESNSHAMSLHLDIVNISSRYYTTLLEGMVLANKIPTLIAQENYLEAIGSTLKVVVGMELFKYAMGKTMEFLSHGPYIQKFKGPISSYN